MLRPTPAAEPKLSNAQAILRSTALSVTSTRGRSGCCCALRHQLQHLVVDGRRRMAEHDSGEGEVRRATRNIGLFDRLTGAELLLSNGWVLPEPEGALLKNRAAALRRNPSVGQSVVAPALVLGYFIYRYGADVDDSLSRTGSMPRRAPMYAQLRFSIALLWIVPPLTYGGRRDLDVRKFPSLRWMGDWLDHHRVELLARIATDDAPAEPHVEHR